MGEEHRNRGCPTDKKATNTSNNVESARRDTRYSFTKGAAEAEYQTSFVCDRK